MRPASWRWTAVILIAGLLHAALAAAVLLWPRQGAPGGAAGAGVQIALGPVGGGAGNGEAEAAEDTEAETAPEPIPEPEPDPQVPPEPAEPRPEPERRPEPAPQPVVPSAPPPPDPEPPLPDLSAPEQERDEPDSTDMPDQDADAETGPEETEPEKSAGSGAVGPADLPAVGTDAGGAGAEPSPLASSGTQAQPAALGSSGARAGYAETLAAWLERHKRYPRRSQRRREEGIGYLYLIVARDGRVLDVRIERSTGYPALDEELLDMVERAKPLPAFPDNLRAAQMEYVLPVTFDLR